MAFNIKDFGAVGDGATDDTSAIQAAIDAAFAAGGGEVEIPEGTFIISGNGDPTSGCLMIKSGVTISGAGMGVSTLKLADGSSGNITGLIRSAYGEETHDFGVNNLTLDGNRDNTTGKVDGWFNGFIPDGDGHDSNVLLDQVEIKDCSGYGFDPHEQTINLTISNSVSHGNGLDGFVADYQIDGRFVNNVAYDNDRHGFNIVTSTHDFELVDNVAYANGGAGIVVQRGSEDRALVDNILISGGAVYGNAAEGVLVKMSTNVTVDGVAIHDNGSAGVRLYGSSGSQVVNNQIHDNAQNGAVPEVVIQAYDDTQGVSSRYYNGDNNLVQRNTITGSDLSTYGIAERREPGTEHNSFYGNVIEHTSKGTTLVYGEGSVASDSVPMHRIDGTDGKDVLVGTASDDLIIGGAGADKLTGGDGHDTFRFEQISDSYRDASTSYADLITDFDPAQDSLDLAGLGFSGLGNGYAGTLAVQYNASTDRTYLKSYEADAQGQRFEVALSGNLVGKLDSSNVSFEHLVLGTAGNDRLAGTSASEIIDGGAGADVLSGGGGHDVFRFSNLLDSYRNYGLSKEEGNHGDLITDFDAGTDRVDLSALGFTGLGNGRDGTLVVVLNDTGDKTYFKSREADANGNQFEFAMSGNHTSDVTAANFIFAPVPATEELTVLGVAHANAA
ncbi:parallel beta-helix repeat (two copies) [Pseudomonas sp. URIL14HWK12:I9]|nr:MULTISPECIES: right-handed parallel beta-helix repeat-containing protein [unclassified Pseudomonas]PVZ19510.1 parallel beta-helix repeat protein [Pseudomonas sp. URIL14HWK12:I12]PVZ22905.1 parallel beta-helix repeat protein [Pseudomonas sp. URIL14HWK12:I10]PVZ37465.1 parallel beta-helix repeat protein [Pseudomonas sp. URIL14HWK12:I11]SNZ14861.1 parallel beta-helix repeat (two copies) [Pseudomonas sp. URIL14HWK12:I9]